MTAPVPTRAELDTAMERLDESRIVCSTERYPTTAERAELDAATDAVPILLDALYDALEDGRDAQRALDLLRDVSWHPKKPYNRRLSAAARLVEAAWDEGIGSETPEPEYALALAIDAAIRHGQGEPTTPEPKEVPTDG